MSEFTAAFLTALIAVTPILVAGLLILGASVLVERWLQKQERISRTRAEESRKAVEEAHFGLWAQEMSDR